MFCVFPSFKFDAKASSYQAGDIIEFGVYPQEQVVDEQLINSLNSLELNWVSYNYYSGDGSQGSMVPGDYMKYADVYYEGNTYRAVIMEKYRPIYTHYDVEKRHSRQEYCYDLNTIYWFKWTPIEWRIIDLDKKMIVSEYLIDSQAVQNTVYASKKSGNLRYYCDVNCTTYASDYASSSIRVWLNNTFYNFAFNESEKSNILTTTLDNSCYDSTKTEYNSATTQDKVFLLSYSDLTEYSSVLNKKAYHTNYARSQNICNNSSDPLSFTSSIWYTRTPRDNARVCGLDEGGAVNNSYCYGSVYCTDGGVRPAMILSEFPVKFSLESHFEAIDHKKRTKRADVEPSDKMRFVEAIIGNDLLNAPTDKASEIKDKIYNLFFKATYRPTEFGGKTSDIKKWPYQNSGNYGTSVFDSGLGETIEWTKPGKGCCSYARFCSQYIHGTNGAYKNSTIISSCKNGSEIKTLLLNYIDPGEAIHYYYDETEHWVVYVGSDNDGFYFLTYEGGASKSGNYHILHLEYVTYARLAETCKNKKIEVWDTNGGSYKMQTADRSTHQSTTIAFRFAALAELYIDNKLQYTNVTTKRNKISTQANSIDEYTLTLLANEKHDIKIIGESIGTFDCKITYSMSDGQQNTREFIDVPLEVDKSVSTSISSCYDQGFLIVDNNDLQTDEIWSVGINEISSSPMNKEDGASNLEFNEIILEPSKTSIDYGDSIVLHIDESKIPTGGHVEWSASNSNFSYTVSTDSVTCTISPSSSGDTTFTATIYDESDTAISTDEQVMTSKAGFFDKIIAFFKKLFGLTKTIPQVF